MSVSGVITMPQEDPVNWRRFLYFLALATDYDGTIATHGDVTRETRDALRRLKETGRRLILVTGRELPDLRRVCPDLSLFDQVIVENGALIYDPSTDEEDVLTSPPPLPLIQRLKAMRVSPLSIGRTIIATWEPHQNIVLDIIRDLGLEWQIIFNKGAIMMLPPGVNKASGLAAALRKLELSAHNVVGVGDAENDHAFLSACGCAAVVSNALPSVKGEADIRLAGDHGAGVIELVDMIIERDALIAPRERHGITIGIDMSGGEVQLEPFRGSILIIGPSGSGKSTLATALTERMARRNFEFCVIDPEGDYTDLEHAIIVGSGHTPPLALEALNLLRDDAVDLVINTQALAPAERRRLFSILLRQISKRRALTGRPHWLVIDEAHQVLPGAQLESNRVKAEEIPAAIFVTAYPQVLSAEVLRRIDVVLALGAVTEEMTAAFEKVTGRRIPLDRPEPAPGELLYWSVDSERSPFPVNFVKPIQHHKRHGGKYAVGDVGAEHSFYFRGPHKRDNIPAKNLYDFIDIASRIGDDIWGHHLRAGDYSAWFRDVIKDEDLASEAAKFERDATLAPAESRRFIRKAVWKRYAAPGEAY